MAYMPCLYVIIIILFDDENISFEASRFMYINSTNIRPIMILLVLISVNEYQEHFVGVKATGA